jgi:excisionase family DNA binding protein
VVGNVVAAARERLMNQLGRSVTIEQAAVLLDCSKRTVYYRIQRGQLRTIRTIGGSQRVLVESIHLPTVPPNREIREGDA